MPTDPLQLRYADEPDTDRIHLGDTIQLRVEATPTAFDLSFDIQGYRSVCRVPAKDLTVMPPIGGAFCGTSKSPSMCFRYCSPSIQKSRISLYQIRIPPPCAISKMYMIMIINRGCYSVRCIFFRPRRAGVRPSRFL